MPLLLAYLKSVPTGNTQHLAKACYALENFVENLGSDGSGEYRGESNALAEGGRGVGRGVGGSQGQVKEVGFVKGQRPGLVGKEETFAQGPKCSPTYPSSWSVCCSL